MRFISSITASVLALAAMGASVTPLPNGALAVEFKKPVSQPKSKYTVERAEGRFATYKKVGATKDFKFVDKNADRAPNTYYYRLVDANGTPMDTVGMDIDLFGDKVVIFSPADDMQAVAKRLAAIDFTMFGREMSADRYTVLFKKGDYRDAGIINVPFYVHIAGLGKTPYEVTLDNIHTPPHLRNDNGTCTLLALGREFLHPWPGELRGE